MKIEVCYFMNRDRYWTSKGTSSHGNKAMHQQATWGGSEQLRLLL
jgi:hypothetical protein